MILIFFRNLFRDLYRQPLRTILTFSGVIWGTFAIVLLLAFGGAVQKQTMKSFRGMGTGIVIVWPSRTTMAHRGFIKGRLIRLSAEDVKMIQHKVPGIRAISPEFRQSRRVRYEKEEVINTVRGVGVAYEKMRNTIPAKGRFIDQLDIEKKRRVCFIGNRIARNLFQDADPVGKQVRIEGIPFVVVGVMIEKIQTSNYGGQRDELTVFIPWTTFSTLYGQKYVSNFLFQAVDSPQVTERIREYLGNKIGFSPKDRDALFVWDFNDMERQMDVFFLAFNLFLGMIGTFTLLVGGVGVASIMLVVVEERTREIGIKLAVGAKRRRILRQFFAEAITIILMGGLAGFLLAAVLLSIIPVEMVEEYVGIPKINPMVGVSTVLILLVIGAISGLVPARRAASTNPIEALRK
jgi:putative ABC transport system permease protein